MYRYRKNFKKYIPDPTSQVCPFCNLEGRHIADTTEHAYVIRSDYPYDLWEFRKVTDHLLLIPKRHVASMSLLDADERADIIELMSHYEHLGYNTYNRAEKSISKSVPDHQHTHLISTTDKKARLGIYISKPYWLFKR
jgi:diadenosine tetraphosphate (Ap4A) HIT family hydrolase